MHFVLPLIPASTIIAPPRGANRLRCATREPAEPEPVKTGGGKASDIL